MITGLKIINLVEDQKKVITLIVAPVAAHDNFVDKIDNRLLWTCNNLLFTPWDKFLDMPLQIALHEHSANRNAVFIKLKKLKLFCVKKKLTY